MQKCFLQLKNHIKANCKTLHFLLTLTVLRSIIKFIKISKNYELKIILGVTTKRPWDDCVLYPSGVNGAAAAVAIGANAKLFGYVARTLLPHSWRRMCVLWT
jgi:hypothetical protein